MANIEKEMEEFCIQTENSKEKIKGELKLVSMNKTAIFIGKKINEFKKNRREKDKIIENLSEKHLKWSHRIDKLENLVDRQKKYSRHNCLYRVDQQKLTRRL